LRRFLRFTVAPDFEIRIGTAARALGVEISITARVTEGVTEISWSGGKLPDDWYDEFVFQGFLAGDLDPAKPMYFPVVQECEKGVNRWIEVPAPGKSSSDYPEPAPVLKLLPGAGPRH
jgi:uncharacterized protein YcnI